MTILRQVQINKFKTYKKSINNYLLFRKYSIFNIYLNTFFDTIYASNFIEMLHYLYFKYYHLNYVSLPYIVSLISFKKSYNLYQIRDDLNKYIRHYY